MAPARTLRGRKQVRQEDDIVFRVSRVGPIVVNWGREGPVSALPEVLSDNLVFVRGQDMVEGLANKLQREEVGGSAMREDHDLDFDGEAPR